MCVKRICPCLAIIGITWLLLGPSIALAADSESISPSQRLALQNIVDAYLECGAYYIAAAEGMGRRTDADTAVESAKKAGEQALYVANSLAQGIQISENAMAAKLQLFSQGLLAEMEGDFANFSVLLAKYSDQCKQALDEPEKFWAPYFVDAEKRVSEDNDRR